MSDTEPPGPDTPIAPTARKGRGAISNQAGRFERAERFLVDDGWTDTDEDLPPLRTTVQPDASRSVISHNDSPDVGFSQSINPYRGCEHGCIYCYARPTHAFLGLSPGLDFETRLFAKFDAPVILERELRRPRYRCQVIALGMNTDPYQPIEREYRITRRLLDVLSRFNHPVGIVTKSALALRDIDILAPLAACGLAQVTVSITTLDRDLARRLEPRAATPSRRIETIRVLSRAGIPTSVNVAPIIPGLTDHETESILQAARQAGARSAGYVLLRLPLEIKDLFQEWLAQHVPDRAQRVLALVRQTRGGALYKDAFGTRMRGEGAYADLIRRRFHLACNRLGLDKRNYVLDSSRFRVPPAPGDQLGLPL